MSNETKIGILSIVTIVIAVWGFKFLKGKNILSSSNFLYAEYQNVDYLQLSAPVIINGFQVGIVSNMYLNPENMKSIIVEFDIRNDIDIPKTTIAQIVPAGMLGEKAVNLKYDKPCSGSACAQSGQYLQSSTVGMVESMLGEGSVDGYIDKMKTSLEGVYKTVSDDLSDPDSKNVMAKSIQDLSVTLENLKETTARMNSLMANSSSKLNDVLANVSKISANVANNDQQIKGIISNTAGFTEKLNALDMGSTLGQVNGTFATTNDAVVKLKTTLDNANKTVGELSAMLNKVNDGNGTLSMLVNDKELYDRLNTSSKNLDMLLEDFRLNPKRYIRSIFVGKKHIPYEAPENGTGSITPEEQGSY